MLGLFVVIVPPIRELLLELMRLPELEERDFCVVGTLGLFVVIELPIRELLLELIRLLELPTCGFVVLRTLGVLVPIELPIRENQLELTRLPELVDVRPPVPELTAAGFLLLIEMLDGLRVLEVTPGRAVTGRLDVTLLDGRLDITLLGGRTLRLLVLLEIVLRSDELRGAALLLELLRTEGLGVLTLAGGLLERDGVVTLAVLLLVLEDCRALGAGEDFGDACFLELLPLDLLLLLDFLSAKPASTKSIRAKISITKVILAFLMYFSVNIIRLLS